MQILLRFAILIMAASVMQTFAVVDGRKSKKRTGSFPTIASKAKLSFGQLSVVHYFIQIVLLLASNIV
jgi:hypothetical protein